MLERRRSKRIVVNLKAEIISDGKCHPGFIENLSEDGIYMITAPTKAVLDFSPGTTLELKFQLPSKERLHLHCRVKWSFKTPPHCLTNSIGLEIIDPSPEYKEFLKIL